MKQLLSSIKQNLRLGVALFGVFIFSNQIYQIIYEKQSIKTQITINNCEIGLFDYLMIVFKCSLAFLAGGIISDWKFIKFGVI